MPDSEVGSQQPRVSTKRGITDVSAGGQQVPTQAGAEPTAMQQGQSSMVTDHAHADRTTNTEDQNHILLRSGEETSGSSVNGHKGDGRHGSRREDHEGSHHYHHDENQVKEKYYRKYFASGAHKKGLNRTKWFSHPVKGREDIWIKPADEATEWLPLFYDLVVVAVLSVFSSTHEIDTPSKIPPFLAFFIIIFWIWVSQTSYDMRYQGDDAINRFFKFCQICIFIYLGAASGNWNPGQINTGDLGSDASGSRLSTHMGALTSWLTVTVGFAVSRAILLVQYLICLIQAKRINRQTSGFKITIATLLFSMILSIIAAALPSTSSSLKAAKISIFYIGIFIEVLDTFFQIWKKVVPPVETHKVAERYGAFTLIILGEGIISISKSFNSAISGLSTDDSGTYVQVFLTVLILYLLWAFLFANFDRNDHVGEGRAHLWRFIHFPLCFGILLLISGMINVVVTLSSAHGVTNVLYYVADVSSSLSINGTVPSGTSQAVPLMNKLSLEPDWLTEMELLRNTTLENPPQNDAIVLFDQYAGQIVYSAFQLYGLDIPQEVTDTYYELYSLNTTWMDDSHAREEIRKESNLFLNEIVVEIENEAFSGVLWLLPVSGCVLILAAVRSMLWYKFHGVAHWIYHGFQITAGVILGLLGMLDIGGKTLTLENIDNPTGNSINPLYRILADEIPLVLVALIYLVVYLGSAAVLRSLTAREKRKRRKEGALNEKAGTSNGGNDS